MLCPTTDEMYACRRIAMHNLCMRIAYLASAVGQRLRQCLMRWPAAAAGRRPRREGWCWPRAHAACR